MLTLQLSKRIVVDSSGCCIYSITSSEKTDGSLLVQPGRLWSSSLPRSTQNLGTAWNSSGRRAPSNASYALGSFLFRLLHLSVLAVFMLFSSVDTLWMRQCHLTFPWFTKQGLL